MFLKAVFGKCDRAERLGLALEQNYSTILIDGLFMRNDVLITIILMGIFIAMVMTSIPALVTALFANVQIPEKYYESTKKHINTMWKNAKKWYSSLKN